VDERPMVQEIEASMPHLGQIDEIFYQKQSLKLVDA
jgi:hypothetical protein